jgi:sugar O-acyltransferase (sialic acid O-acetyltransferase NeuD family)
MKKKLVIFGTGDVARLAHFYFTRDGNYDVAAFTVDRAYVTTDLFLGTPLVAFEEIAQTFPPGSHHMFVAVGYGKMNHGRAEKYAEAKALGYQLATYISPRCTWLTDSAPGDNCFILEDNTVQPFVTIGSDVTLWSGNHIGHDAVIHDHCFISSHVVISGHVRVGEYCFLGVNATIRNGVTIAPETLVGAGSIIMADTEPKSVYVPERTAVFKRTSDRVKI